MLSSALSCKNSDKTPDVSNINIELTTQRFEQELFKLDTNNISPNLERVISKYPSFGENFLTTILNIDARWSSDSAALYVKGFIGAYRKVYDSSQAVFPDFKLYKKQLEKSLQYVKYYFPSYKAPQKIITYIGPLDGFGDILAEDAFIIGLHHHLGKNFSLYSSSFVNETYPAYISNRFEPGYIQVNCMKNIVNDMYPEKFEDKSLVIQMVEKGKRLYMLSLLLPSVDENKLIGYTEKQLKESYLNEKIIWDLFVQNNFLQTIDNNVIKNYIGEGPKTMELGEASPGNIGSFAGWQIVKKYMDKNPSIKLSQLMATEADLILQQAKYKP